MVVYAVPLKVNEGIVSAADTASSNVPEFNNVPPVMGE